MAGLIGLTPAIVESKQGFSMISLTGFTAGLFLLSYFSLFVAVRVGLPKFPINTLRDE